MVPQTETDTNPEEEQPRPNTTNGSQDEQQGYAYIQYVTPKSTNNEKLILSPMKVHFPESAVTAILGPSGSGKTTLLSVVTNSIPSNITALAKVKLDSAHQQKGLVAFVPQDDRLHGFYTCRSYLMHYARLAGIHRDPDIHERIETLLKQLGLSEQADTIVGDLFFKGLSGGQKRRLSVALEALTQPQTLFLDEPTSGLDAESALQVMMFLKQYVRAAAGRRVILTIHQPSSFIWEIIDHSILLSKGKLMYDGARPAMEDFFATHNYPTPVGWNPADHYVTVRVCVCVCVLRVPSLVSAITRAVCRERHCMEVTTLTYRALFLLAVVVVFCFSLDCQ